MLFCTVIFAVDVKVSNDSYCKCMLATCDQKTIVITNPGVIISALSNLNWTLLTLIKWQSTSFLYYVLSSLLSDSGEAHQLYQYAQTVESDLFKEPAGEDKRTSFTEDANDNSKF